jgi:hypothetical protein
LYLPVSVFLTDTALAGSLTPTYMVEREGDSGGYCNKGTIGNDCVDDEDDGNNGSGDDSSSGRAAAVAVAVAVVVGATVMVTVMTTMMMMEHTNERDMLGGGTTEKGPWWRRFGGVFWLHKIDFKPMFHPPWSGTRTTA